MSQTLTKLVRILNCCKLWLIISTPRRAVDIYIMQPEWEENSGRYLLQWLALGNESEHNERVISSSPVLRHISSTFLSLKQVLAGSVYLQVLTSLKNNIRFLDI
jgi:hypothetical protein